MTFEELSSIRTPNRFSLIGWEGFEFVNFTSGGFTQTSVYVTHQHSRPYIRRYAKIRSFSSDTRTFVGYIDIGSETLQFSCEGGYRTACVDNVEDAMVLLKLWLARSV